MGFFEEFFNVVLGGTPTESSPRPSKSLERVRKGDQQLDRRRGGYSIASIEELADAIEEAQFNAVNGGRKVTRTASRVHHQVSETEWVDYESMTETVEETASYWERF